MSAQISICIIGKNEEKHIGNCLESLSALGIPIIYTDTGSTDNTVPIAEKYTNHIFHFDWINDFSAARNYCAEQASTDWVWVLDCDEYLTDANLSHAENLLKQLDSDADSITIGTVRQKDSFLSGNERIFAVTPLGRIYNKKQCHYIGSIHEQITPLESFQGKETAYCPFPFELEHHGYSDPATLPVKTKRNIDLLLYNLDQQADPYLYYQLGKAYQAIQETELACDAYGKGLEFDLDPNLFYVQSMVEAYGYCLLDLKEYQAALSFQSIYEAFSNRADFVFLMGLIYMNNAMFEDAISEFKKATAFKTATVEGVNSYRANYNIGVIYECLGDKRNALHHYQMCKDFAPALSRIKEISI